MHIDNVELICSIAELAACFENSHSIQEFLQKVVTTVAKHMNATVCSAYLYNESQEELVLRATWGLHPSAVNQVRLKLGEGITGAALKELRPICVAKGSYSEHFKSIPGIEEEEHSAFLAVPILRGLSRVGVLVVQHRQEGFFGDDEVKAMRAIASQLATTIENAKLLMSTTEETTGESEPEAMHYLRSGAGSPGIAYGTATVLGTDARDIQAEALAAEGEQHTLEDFENALSETSRQLEDLQAHMEAEQVDVAATLIFSAHLLILKDSAFTGQMRTAIEEGATPASAIAKIVTQYVGIFAKSPVAHLREKVRDVEDLGHRMLRNLRHKEGVEADYRDQIVVAPEILPSEVMKLKAQNVAGIVLTTGSLTAHVLILARSLDIPMVAHREPRLLRLKPTTKLLIDGTQGHIFIDPDGDVLTRYEHLHRDAQDLERLAAGVHEQTWSADGQRIELLANINLLSELHLARLMKAEGIGLYRSEFPYIIRTDFPTEQDQYRIYSTILEQMGDTPVTFRTLDIGGDKILNYFASPQEANPFLGLRAIRFSLRYKETFCEQLRAMLQAGVGRELRIMFPLIGSLDEFLEAREVVRACQEQLTSHKLPHNKNPKLGIMVELPSAVALIDALAKEVDFMSIGSNDLTQYILAADRTNQAVADYYIPHHPAVLRALKLIADAAIRHHKSLSICGEIAGHPRMLTFLLGIGIRRLSLNSRLISQTQPLIESISTVEAEAFARKALQADTIKETTALFGYDKP
jgi:phosphotransferase system enzyme I (PtsP)